MSKKLKVRASALIMCAAMLVTSMTVLAADVESTEKVALDGSSKGTAIAGIMSLDTVAYAHTRGTSLYNDILYTSISGYGYMPDEATGYSYAEANGSFTSASSYHKWTSRTHTITVYA